MKMEFWARQGAFGRHVDVYMANAVGGELRPISAVFNTHPADMSICEPLLRLDREEGQQLIDALWSASLRPTEGSGSAGSLAATERHLQDMQRIAIGLLKKGGVPL